MARSTSRKPASRRKSPKQSPAQKKTVGRVMHEWKHGELKTRGRKVKNPRQAIAIALSEAGASRNESKGANRRNLSRTKRKERQGRTAQQAAEGRMGAGGASRRKSATARGGTARKSAASGRSTAARRKASGAGTNQRKSAANGRRAPRGRATDGTTRAALYQKARKRNIPGRSRMSKAELERALRA